MQKNSSTLIFVIVILLLVIEQAAINLYLPSMPTMTNYFQTDSTDIQYTITLFLVGVATSRIILGPMADQYGRKPILLFSNLLFILGAVGCALAPSVWFLWLCRLIQGAGSGGVTVLTLTILRDVYEGKTFARYASYTAVAWAATPVVAPLFGGYIEAFFGWRENFALMAILAIGLQILAYVKLTETMVQAPTKFSVKKIMASYKTLMSSRLFTINSLMLLFLSGLFFAFSTIGPFILQKQLGYSPVDFGWFSVFTAGGYMLGSFLNGRWVMHIDDKKLSLFGSSGFLLFAIIMLLLGFAYFNAWVIIIPMAIMLFSIGFIFANSMNGCMAEFPELAGAASALMGVFIFVGTIIASLIAANISYHTQIPLAWLVLGIALGNIILFFGFLYRQEVATHESLL